MSDLSPRSLRQRIALSLTVFALLVSVPIIVVGAWMNERAEQAIWQAMLSAEMAEIAAEVPANGGFHHHGVLNSYVWRSGDPSPRGVPAAFASLPKGVHDDIEFNRREWAVLIGERDGVRMAVSIDISELEAEEATLSAWAVAMVLLAFGLLWLALNWMAGRAVVPVTQLSAQLMTRSPTATEAFETAYQEREIKAVVGALNGFVERIREHVQEERQFVETMSHELRTPLAVILGAVEVLELRGALEPRAAPALQRIRQTAGELQHLAQVLLFLSSRNGTPVALETVDMLALLQARLDSFREEFAARGLTLQWSRADAVSVPGLRPLCEVVVNNLIRNCCDHGSGSVDITLSPHALEISNTVGAGQGVEPPSPSPLWRANAGLGLDLIARICRRFGWTLQATTDGERFQARVGFVAPH